MKVTVLGSASSYGTPAAGGFWGKCDPSEPKNTRLRASIYVQSEKSSLIVDASYDLRTQMNNYQIQNLDGFLISHSHSDHVNGIDDLRAVSHKRGAPLDLYGTKETLDEINRRWPYLFKDISDGIYSPFLAQKVITDEQEFMVGDIRVSTFEQDHGVMPSTGFRFGDFAYSIDLVRLKYESIERLKGIKYWIVDGAAYDRENHDTHADLKQVYEWVNIIKPEKTWITCLTTKMDYQTLARELPAGIYPAYDGLVIEF